MNISLTPMMEKFIKDQVKSGLYSNASEVVRLSLRNLILDQSDQRQSFVNDIKAGRQAIAKGEFSQRKIKDIVRKKMSPGTSERA
jgi:antitoxin ParD1/3/4